MALEPHIEAWAIERAKVDPEMRALLDSRDAHARTASNMIRGIWLCLGALAMTLGTAVL